MKLAILSRQSKLYSTRRLFDAAKKKGISVKVFDVTNFSLDLETGSPDLYYKQKRIPHYDAILPRIGPSVTYLGTAVVRQFQQMDVYCPNPADGIINSRDKLRAFQVLSRHKVPIPATTFVKNQEDILPAIERVGGVPIVIKLLEGTQGKGVLLAETTEVAMGLIEFLQGQQQNILIQKFVSESRGKDIRAFVIGDQVVAAMRRVAQGQEFRSNVHLGGQTEMVELSDEFKETAIRATRVLGLGIAGVDLLEGKDGPQIMEINSSPGLEGIEACTKLDIAGAIIDYIAAKVDVPEIDYREKLTVSKGYGISEILIPKGSEYVGKDIETAFYSDGKINILTLSRSGKIIPNPKSNRVLEANDKLLCFGSVESIKHLIPERVRRKRRPKLKKLNKRDAI